MDLSGILRHLAMTSWQVRHAFPASTLKAIEEAVRASESSHGGELRFVVEGALDGAPLWRGQSARERAIDLFGRLRVWDTEHNNGVLIYVLLADRRVEIVADRGIHACCRANAWTEICRGMEERFAKGDFGAGSVLGIEAVTGLLACHFPVHSDDHNELPDNPVVL
ncbi:MULTISPECIES: TPM domain-containing protein [Comamonadaceae]|uniref:TPM domain-containing protein n=1 Tax=Alicycliphilus denitrificans (strain DSM 14773 / CIP 107495 / K601) TaxID=596154 RepID=F4G9X6_ALIDK|nr:MULTISPECIES: TPM domain-containing protein [Comamonadaceae]AEB85708.1 protein of unknown function DUF477 [Alicycliphilus denitrificans K601]